MPPLPRLRLEALAELDRQLRYQPAEAARRQLLAAEALVRELAADDVDDRVFPEDWVIARITGYRPELETPALIVGRALVADLVALVERLSVAAGVTVESLLGPTTHHSNGEPAAPPHAWLTPEQVCARWRISRKTLDRYRRRGLIARRAVRHDARHRLFFAEPDVARFEERHHPALARAASFERIDPQTEQRILRRAARYRAEFGCTLNQAAQRLARRFGRSHEAVRQLLARHDAGADHPIFAERGPLTEREGRILERAHRRSVPMQRLTQRYGRTRTAIHRAILITRARMLLDLDLDGPRSPDFVRPDARARLLQPAAVREQLGRPLPRTLADLLEQADAGARPPSPRIESARAAAIWFLRAQAADRLATLDPAAPTAAELDRIETDLRWASRLRAELLRDQLPTMLRSLAALLDRPLTTLPTHAAAELLRLALVALSEATGRHDPFRGGRLAAPVGLAINREVSQWLRARGARWAKPAGAGLATPRSDPADILLPDLATRLDPWQRWLEPDARILRALHTLDPSARDLLTTRFGWDGPPQTLEELARNCHLPTVHVARMITQACKTAIRAPAAGPT